MTTSTRLSFDDVRARIQDVVLSFSSEYSVFDEASVQNWHVSAEVVTWDDNDVEQREHIADISIVVADTYDNDELFWILDGDTVDLGTIAGAVLSPDGGLRDDLENGLGSNLVILDGVTLAEGWRGHGVGPLLAGLALKRFEAGAGVFATFPSPYGEYENPDHPKIVKRLRKTWATLGFEKYRKGVWVLDPSLHTFDERLDMLKEKFGIAY
jgi:hypothetical protein